MRSNLYRIKKKKKIATTTMYFWVTITHNMVTISKINVNILNDYKATV